MKQLILTACILFALQAEAVDPVKIDISNCGAGFEDLTCTIDEVKIDCAIDRNTKACRLKRAQNYTMDVDFTPDFEGSDVTMLAYALLPLNDAEFEGMDDNACNWMKCPVVANTQQRYTFVLSMSKGYPKGLFNVRWLMKAGGEKKCCFTNKFKIE